MTTDQLYSKNPFPEKYQCMVCKRRKKGTKEWFYRHEEMTEHLWDEHVRTKEEKQNG